MKESLEILNLNSVGLNCNEEHRSRPWIINRAENKTEQNRTE